MKRCICLEEADLLIISKKALVVVCEDCLDEAIELIEAIPPLNYGLSRPTGFCIAFYAIWRCLHKHYIEDKS